MLLALNQQAKRGVDHIEMGIDAERGGEEHRPVRRVAIEEIAVVKVAVGAGKRHRLRRLVDRIVIAPCQHGVSLLLLGKPKGWGCGSASVEGA